MNKAGRADPSAGAGAAHGPAMSELVVWSAAAGGWHKCPPDEITWLDRSLLSGGRDLTLHRSPRCPGLRHVHHRWELFSRDISHLVYAAPSAPGAVPDHREVEAAARFVLPAGPRRVRADAGPAGRRGLGDQRRDLGAPGPGQRGPRRPRPADQPGRR